MSSAAAAPGGAAEGRLFGRRGLTLLSAQRWAGSLAALSAFAACAASGELGLPLLILFPAALAGAELYGARVAGRAGWAWTALLIAALLAIAALVIGGRLDIVLGAAFFSALLCIHRLWHRRTERDEYLLFLLSLLLLCAGAALSAELLFGLAFLAYAVAATWALALTHLRFEIEAGRGPEGSAALLQSRRLATPALLGALAALAMLGLAGSAIVFFTFPRVTIGGLRRQVSPRPVAGLGDQVDLKRHGVIADDPRIVLRVRLSPEPAVAQAGDNLGLHWRARALEVWTGQGWRARMAGYGPATRLPGRPQAAARSRQDKRRSAPVLTADIEAVGGFSDGVVLTPPGWPVNVDFVRPVSARGAPQRLYRNAAGDLFYQPVEVGDLRYLVTVDQNEPRPELLRGSGQDYPPAVQGDLEVPAHLDPRVRALAQQLAAGRDPVDAALAVERYLSSSYKYTRELPGDSPDPIASFLFERKRGHCELFSSAMVILLRAAGIAARNVTGYYGGLRSDAGYYAVRAGDAHSWVEVYFPGKGFVAFDPTPSADRGSTQDGAWAKLVLLWDSVSQKWRAFVVDYDLLTQGRLAQRAGALLREAGARLSGKGSGKAFRLAWAKTLLLVLALAAAAWVVWRRRAAFRRRTRPPPLGSDQKRALLLWRAARARLVRAGVALGEATTAREAAARAGPRAAAAAGELAERYLASRWGGARLPPSSARELLRELDAALK